MQQTESTYESHEHESIGQVWGFIREYLPAASVIFRTKLFPVSQ
jgi:hypothetical protein